MRLSLSLVSSCVAAALLCPPSLSAHPATSPPVPVVPPPDVEEIPAADEDRYLSRLDRIVPVVPRLEADVTGGQEKLRLTWTGGTPLVVDGYRGEPMFRMSSRGIFLNRRSPSAYLSAERYGRVGVPVFADSEAPPLWQFLDTPGPFSWYDHRIQWMRAERPRRVGDGSRSVTIFHWSIPVRVAGRAISIRGTLEWIADPAVVRAERSRTSSPLGSGLALVIALLVGAGVGVLIRKRIGQVSR